MHPEQRLVSAQAFTELGYTGLKQSGGLVIEDPLPQLRTLTERMRVFSEMRNDPIIGAVLFVVDQLARSAKWDIVPPEGDRQESDVELLQRAMNGLEHSWDDFVTGALTMLPYGFSLHEIVYKPDSDGTILWKKFAFRAQESVWKWEFSPEGETLGFWQQINWSVNKPHLVRIPREKVLHLRTTPFKGNPEGTSVLRWAYRPYYFKKRLEVIEAIGVERDLAGYPVLWVPDEIFLENDDAKKMKEYAVNIVTRIRKDENMGSVMPQSWKEAGGLELLSSQGGRSIDTDKIIQRYESRMAMSVLADVILMGHENAGSYALAEVKRGLLDDAIGTWLDVIAEALNRHAIPQLFALNGINPQERKLPKLIHGPVASMDMKTLADVIFRLTGVDALRTGPNLRRYLRHELGIPEEDSDDIEESQLLIEAREREAIGRMLGGRPDNETRPSPTSAS